jgi:hypothetical protein
VRIQHSIQLTKATIDMHSYPGVPFARRGHENYVADQGKTKAQNSQNAADSFSTLIFGLLEELLPSVDKVSNFDLRYKTYNVHFDNVD